MTVSGRAQVGNHIWSRTEDGDFRRRSALDPDEWMPDMAWSLEVARLLLLDTNLFTDIEARLISVELCQRLDETQASR